MIKESFIPNSIEDAVTLKKNNGDDCYFLAGGTELNSIDNKRSPETVIVLEKLGLNKIIKQDNTLIIESCVSFQELADNPDVPEIIRKTANHMTNRNIRNMATIGGNIGTNKSCANMLPLLTVLDAELETVNLENQKQNVKVIDYVSSEKKDLILNIRIPLSEFEKKVDVNVFIETANDISLITSAVSYNKNEGKLSEIKIAAGGISKHIKRLTEIENFLEGKSLPEKKELQQKIKDSVNPITDVRGSAEFKKHIVSVLITELLYK
jgi:probable selenate reductase FAD-binding subunit